MKVILAEDHELVRAGLRALLDRMPDISVVAEATEGRQALQLARVHRPDVVLMDIAMSGLNGLEATAQIRRELPDVKVIIVSMHADEEYVFQAWRAGASGYVLKESSASELESALDAVGRGEVYFSIPVSALLDRLHSRTSELPPLDRLTARQREVLQLIAEGHTSREIASILGIGIKTVETHRTNLMELLDIHEVAGLVRFAIRVSLIRPS